MYNSKICIKYDVHIYYFQLSWGTTCLNLESGNFYENLQILQEPFWRVGGKIV